MLKMQDRIGFEAAHITPRIATKNKRAGARMRRRLIRKWEASESRRIASIDEVPSPYPCGWNYPGPAETGRNEER